MTNVKLGLIIGSALGLVDGCLAFLSPEAIASGVMPFIIVASTIKGVLTGLVIGFVSKECSSTVLSMIVGLLVGLGLSSLLALSPDQSGNYHFAKILVPGSILGGIFGFVCSRWGHTAVRSAVRTDAA